MNSFRIVLLLNRPLRVAAILAVGVLFATGSVRAAFVLDDFNDSVSIASPESDNQWAITDDVGPLNAMRHVRIAWGQGDPEGRLDANISTSSVLTAEVLHLNPRNQLSKPIVSVQFQYSFDAVDFTESGINDAIALDFLRFGSEIPPSQFRVAINGWYYSLMPGPQSTEPFTLVIPFDSVFFTRDGQPGQPDFHQVRVVEFSIRVSQWTGGGPDPLNFLMQLDRIRVGRIPEPTCFLTCWLGLIAMMEVRIGRL